MGGAGRSSSYLAHIRITIIRKVDTKANKCAYVDVVVGQGTRITSWETVPLRAQRFSLFSRTAPIFIFTGVGVGVWGWATGTNTWTRNGKIAKGGGRVGPHPLYSLQ